MNSIKKNLTWTAPEARNTAHEDLGLVDEKGRIVGFLVTRWTAAVEAADENRGWRPELDQYEIGTVLHVGEVQATRDGQPYGASGTRHAYTSYDRLDQALATALAGGRARYTKKYGR